MDRPLNVDPDRFVFNKYNYCSCYTPDEFNSLHNGDTTFSILHINARSLSRNFDNIYDFLSTISHNCLITAISETWVYGQPSIPFHLNGYNFEHSDRPSWRERNVALFVTDNINYHIRYDMSHNYAESVHEYQLIDCSITQTSLLEKLIRNQVQIFFFLT